MSRRTMLVMVTAATVLASGFIGVEDSAGFWGGRFGHRGSTPINWKVAGTIVFVQLAFTDPENQFQVRNGILVDAIVKGPPGNAQFKVVGIPGEMIFPSEESPTTPHCGVFPEIPYDFDDFVAVFADQSMLFATLDAGWVCIGPIPAEFHLVVTGGTGRFEDARGQFVGSFQGVPLGEGASGALLAETGTITGWIER